MVDTDTQKLPGNASGQPGGAGTGGGERGQHRCAGGGGLGDAAYGDGARGRPSPCGPQLVARVPGRPDRKHFPKDDFVIDLAAGSCTCPAGQVTHTTSGRMARGEGLAGLPVRRGMSNTAQA